MTISIITYDHSDQYSLYTCYVYLLSQSDWGNYSDYFTAISVIIYNHSDQYSLYIYYMYLSDSVHTKI